MRRDSALDVTAEITSALRTWRTGALNALLVVVALLALPAIAAVVAQAIRDPSQWVAVVVFSLLYLPLLVFAVFRRIDVQVRAWGLLLLGYVTGVVGFARGGLVGDGRVYLLALPILALILVGVRSGLVMAALSIVTFIAFAIFADQGWLGNWLITSENSLEYVDWLSAGTTLLMLMAPVVVLLWSFIRFQTRTLEAERRAATRLARSSTLLQERAEELEKANKSLAEHMEALGAAAEVARQTASLTSVQDLIQRFVDLVAERFDLYHANIFLLDDRGEKALLRAAFSEAGQRLVGQGYEIPVGPEDPVGQVAQNGKIYLSPAPVESLPGVTWARWRVVLPLQIGDKILGVLDVHFGDEQPPSEDQVQILRALADQLSVGLENARLFAQSQSNLEELRNLYQSMTSEVWQRFVETEPELKRFQAGLAQVSEESWHMLFAEAQDRGESISASYGQVEGNKHHVLAVPVKLRGIPIGAVGFHRPAEDGGWRAEEIALAEGAAERMALSLENVRLLKEARSRTERLALINRISTVISAMLDLDRLVDMVYQQVAPVFQADAFFVALYNQETNEIDFRLRMDEGELFPPERRPLESGLTSVVVEQNAPLLIRNYEEEKEHLPTPVVWGKEVPPSWLGVPMRIGDRVVGVISVQSYRPYIYGEEDQQLLSTVADQLAIAIQNAQMFESAYNRAEQEHQVSEAVARMRETLDVETVLRTAADEIYRVLNLDELVIRLLDPESDDLEAVVEEPGRAQ